MTAQPVDQPVDVACTARSWSVESKCGCADCTAKRCRVMKLRRSGVRVPDRSVDAWAAIDRMLASGRTLSAIAATAGIDRKVFSAMLRARRNRGQKRIRYARAVAIIEAETRPAVGGYVDATGARRRLQALAVMGWSQRALSDRSGVGARLVHHIQSGGVTTTAVRNVEAIARMYTEIQDVRGGSEQTANLAVLKGWDPPAAWDDVDDPGEKTLGMMEREAAEFAARVEANRRAVAELSYTDAELKAVLAAYKRRGRASMSEAEMAVVRVAWAAQRARRAQAREERGRVEEPVPVADSAHNVI